MGFGLHHAVAGLCQQDTKAACRIDVHQGAGAPYLSEYRWFNTAGSDHGFRPIEELTCNMEERAVDLLPGMMTAWVREDARRRSPLLDVRITKEWRTEEDFDQDAYGIGEDDDLRLVLVMGVLEISPRRGRGGWKLILRADDADGLLADPGYEDYEDDEDLTLEGFEQQFLIPEKGEVEVIVEAEDQEAWARFQRWLVRRRTAA